MQTPAAKALLAGEGGPNDRPLRVFQFLEFRVII